MSNFGKMQRRQIVSEKRRAPRHKANAPAIIQTTVSQFDVTISDVSASGARVVSRCAPPSRQDVRLYVNGLWLFGRIAWRREKAFGIKFDEGLNDHSPTELQNAVAQASASNYQFDREAVLSELTNKELNDSCVAEEEEHVA